MKALEGLSRLMRGPAASGALKRLGIDAKHYWLLIDLFGALSERRERMGQLGRSGILLKSIALIYGILAALMSLMMAGARMELRTYLLTFLGMTAFLLFSILISEVSNNVVNPVEALVLAHQPVDGATYTAASLSHLVRVLLYLVPALNTVPALMGLTLRDARWTYPFEHLIAAAAVGLIVALACCGIFGWLVRFVPAPRLKSAAQMAEFLPALAFVFLGPSRALIRNVHFPSWLADNSSLQLGLVLAFLGLAIAGIRSLSLDYLVRVSSIVRGRSAPKSPNWRRNSFVGGIAARFFGGQPGRAGFEFVRKLMVRDWQARRQLIGLAPSLVIFGGMIARGWRVSPFSGRFSPLQFLPHAIGFVLLGVCPALTYGSDYKGVWVFLLIPIRAFRRFGAGLFYALWLMLVVLPHLVLFPLLSYAWGVFDASLFSGFSLAIVSLYLSLEMRLIDGVPFGKQLEANRSALMFPVLIAYVVGAALAVAVQHYLIFRSSAAVAAVTLAAGTAAFFAARSSLESLEIAMIHHLGTMSSESTLLYHEIS
jgi:hypothetical protein